MSLYTDELVVAVTDVYPPGTDHHQLVGPRADMAQKTGFVGSVYGLEMLGTGSARTEFPSITTGLTPDEGCSSVLSDKTEQMDNGSMAIFRSAHQAKLQSPLPAD